MKPSHTSHRRDGSPLSEWFITNHEVSVWAIVESTKTRDVSAVARLVNAVRDGLGDPMLPQLDEFWTKLDRLGANDLRRKQDSWYQPRHG